MSEIVQIKGRANLPTKGDQMKAVVIHSTNDLRVESQAPAPVPAQGEVRVDILRGGICGSDLHYFHHGGFGTVRLKEPMILGHEVSGRIAEVGAGVSGLAVGDNVAINPSVPCGECEYCQRGKRNQCLDMRFFGSAMRFPHQQGLFRQSVTLPAQQAVKLGAGTDLGHAAIAEPFAVCLHAVAQAGDFRGKRVLVSGCGPIGCLTVLAAAQAGAAEIIATDLSPSPLAIAARMGAGQTIDLSADPTGLDLLAAPKGTVDVVFECSGNVHGIAAACRVVRAGGTIVTVGLGPDVPMPLGLIVTKEINMIGSFRFDEEFALAVQMIDRGVVDVSPLITGTFPIEASLAAFTLASDRARAMKVQIDLTRV